MPPTGARDGRCGSLILGWMVRLGTDYVVESMAAVVYC